MVDPGDGQVRRPRDELPQRPRPRLPLRGRRARRFHIRRSRRSGETTKPALLQRAGAADHQDRQPLGPVRPALRSRRRGCGPPAGAARWRRRSSEFRRYFAEGQGQLWERQALCKARVVYGSPRSLPQATVAVSHAAFAATWRRRRRRRNPPDAAAAGKHGRPGDLKRGPGGIVDIEFLVQMLQLEHGARLPRDSCARHFRGPGGIARGRPARRR